MTVQAHWASDVLLHFVAWGVPYYVVSMATRFSDEHSALAVLAGWVVATIFALVRSTPIHVAVIASGAWLLIDLGLFLFASDESYPDRPDTLTARFLLLLLLRSVAFASPLVFAAALRIVLQKLKAPRAP